MARKRMFDLEIINQDSFFDLPMDAKALYFLLGMEADDEGFVSPKKVLRLYGGSEDSLKILALKNYIIPFKSGVVVITDWYKNNYLDKRRVQKTIYQEEKAMLEFDENVDKYRIKQVVKPMLSQCLANVKPMLSENSIEENSIVENNIEEKKYKRKEERYFEDEELNNLFLEFLSMRKKIKAVNSERAIKMLINKLNKYDDFTKKKMIEKSIVNSWKDVYELKPSELTKKEPEWFDKKLEQEKTTKEEEEELKSILDDLGDMNG